MNRAYCIPCLATLITLLTATACITGHAQQQDDAEAGFTPLFDGETLDGWHKTGGDGEYHVDNGEIVGVCDNTALNTFLRTDRLYADFEFRCEFKWDQPSNSGIQYRSAEYPDDHDKHAGRVYGYQFELDPSPRAWSGGLYEERRRGWLQNLAGDQDAEKRRAINLDGWNQVVIRCEGNHLRTWLNGVAITDYVDEADQALTEGFIALQVHSGKAGTMRWRNLRIKELD